MLKPTTVFLLAIMFVTGTMHGQTLSNPPKDSRMNLKQAIARETEKIKNESAAIDPKKLDKMQRQTPQKNWSSKTVITVIVVALVVLAVVLALNSKRCIRRSPPGCSFADDINCECLEYAQ